MNPLRQGKPMREGPRGVSGAALCLFGLPLLVSLPLLVTPRSEAATLYDPIVEWNGPYFRVIHAALSDQSTDVPIHDIPFVQPTAVAAREHGTHQRDVVYVVDSGHSRVQAFEVNATYRLAAHPSAATPFTYQSGGVTAASQWDATHINLPEWAASAAHFVVPFSETVAVDGNAWAPVADLTGFTAANRVYQMSYDDATDAPYILFPAASLSNTSTFEVRYLLSDEHTGAAPSFGIGDVDYGTGLGGSPVLTRIDGSSGGPSSWQLVRSIGLVANEADSTSDDIFLVDPADASEQLFYYTVDEHGAVSFRESYTDELSAPWDLAVARSGPSEAATVAVTNDTGPFDQTSAAVQDANQVTGHGYSISVSGSNVTITDTTTGRVLVDDCPFAYLADPFYGIPGVVLRKNPAVGASNSVTTVQAVPGRFLFVADTTANQIKVISAADGSGWVGDWLPGDQHAGSRQPTAADSVGIFPDKDYRYTTPDPVPEDYAVYTNAYPIEDGSLETILFYPAGLQTPWTRIDDLSTAGPTDKKFQLDWTTGRITFGDGTHGEVPPANTTFEFDYATTPDVLRYGSTGSADGQFSKPKGVAARWNAALGAYDVYVADTGNKRVQKFTFSPRVPDLNLPARMELVCKFNKVKSQTDSLNTPVDIAVMPDRQSAGTNQTCFVAVADRGRQEIVIYRDTAATLGGGTTVPAFDNLLGQAGTTLGSYSDLTGVTFLRHGDDLDLYTADASRGVITKYEEAAGPSITLSLSGTSTLPRTLPPNSSYPFHFGTSNPPAGGSIDFYYDTSASFSSTVSKLCLIQGSIAATATSAQWSFASTPGGAPGNGSYYLFARMKDAAGLTVATDQTPADNLLHIDTNAVPTLSAQDAVDGDRTVYLQNGLSRQVLLQVAYPESVTTVGFDGTFDHDLVQITSIVPGDGWDETGATSVIFTQSHDNATGKFHVNTSAAGAPLGLNSPGPHSMAIVTLRAQANALSPSHLYGNGTLSVVKSSSGMTGIRGTAPSVWQTQNANIRLGYLGDLATDGSGADSTVPHLAPKPDGKINFADQMAFTLGWNGAGHQQDRLADLGPATGVPPELSSNPDGVWDFDDILTFTAMYSWAAAAGYQRTALAGPTPCVQPEPLGDPVSGDAEISTVAHLSAPFAPGNLVVDLIVDHARDLTGVLCHLFFDPRQLEFVALEDGGFLRGADGALFFPRVGSGWCELSSSRLDRAQPGVSGSGTLARASFRVLTLNPSPLRLEFDLRGSDGRTVARGTRVFGPFEGEPTAFALFPARPNPMRDQATIVFSLSSPCMATLDLFDPAGRCLRRWPQDWLRPGTHVIDFDGRDQQGRRLPSGIYFFKLEAGGRISTDRLVVTR